MLSTKKTRRLALLGAMLACTVLPAVAQERKDSTEYDSYGKYRVGGYGEMVANFKNYGTTRYNGTAFGNAREHRATISIPRFVVAFDYKFSQKWILGAEVEFESGGTGVAKEIESTENQFEYETEIEKGGEVALEQFHITRLLHRSVNLRFGHLIVPVGLTNAHHEPILFFGAERPESETTFLPSTWHETGVEVFGSFGRNKSTFNYQAMAVAGLNPDNFGRDAWVKDGKQGIFEADNFSSPAYVARLDYVGLPGLRLGASAYFNPQTHKNADKPYKYAALGRTDLCILSADVQYICRYLTLRGNAIWGHLANANGISTVHYGTDSPYHTGQLRKVAQEALAYGGEVGLNLKNMVHVKHFPTLFPFVRYEYFNPQQRGQDGAPVEDRCQVSKWQAGVNYYVLPYLVVKLDYSNRRIGTQRVFGYKNTYNRENEISLGVAYTNWFWRDKKRH